MKYIAGTQVVIIWLFLFILDATDVNYANVHGSSSRKQYRFRIRGHMVNFFFFFFSSFMCESLRLILLKLKRDRVGSSGTAAQVHDLCLESMVFRGSLGGKLEESSLRRNDANGSRRGSKHLPRFRAICEYLIKVGTGSEASVRCQDLDFQLACGTGLDLINRVVLGFVVLTYLCFLG